MPSDVTHLLQRACGGNRTIVDELMPYVYDELQRIARGHLRRERPDHTFSTGALVHEAYLRLIDQTRADWNDRAHFCAVAARAMRHILIDHARARQALKRGGRQEPVPLDQVQLGHIEQPDFLLALDQALDRLATFDERLARVVEYRFFGGMSTDEVATVMDVSARTIRRDWAKARAWLFKELYPNRS